MGSFPGAQLMFGVDFGEDYEPEWFEGDEYADGFSASEAAEKRLKEAGIAGVSVETYGNRNSGYTRLFLSAAGRSFYAYGPAEFTPKMLTEPPEAADAVIRAYEVLNPGEDCPKPGWFLTLTYG